MAGAGLVLSCAAANAQTIKIKREPAATCLDAPVAMAQPAGDSRMFVAEHWGRVMIAEDGQVNGAPFLDIRNLVVDQHPDFDERGLIGLSFHPDFANNGKFQVACSGRKDPQGDLGQLLWCDHNSVVAEYTVSADHPDAADPKSGLVLSSIAWPQFNPNGHWIGFGPDGMLHVSTGDVGLNSFEEVDIVTKGGNYGWRVMEGANASIS